MHTLLSIVTALVVGGAGIYDFTNPPQVLQLMHDLGYKPGFHRSLGIIKLAGAVGLLLGLQAINLGLVAAFGLVVYFGLAVRAHRRLGHNPNEFVPAIALLGLTSLTFLSLLFS
ncbi:MAG: DoxX family protein [Acidobacteria bacterium]|nr:DoxX family protein [Acidobacteriota bacterium]